MNEVRGRWAPELSGKTAIVTGAGRYSSIGRPIALELARQGVNVVLVGTGRAPELYPRDEQEMGWRDIDSVAGEAEAAGAQALPIIADISDPDAIARLFAATRDRFGGVDILVNNAGAARGDDRVPFVDLAVEEWDRVLDINLRGAFLMAQSAARAMIAQGRGGVILNISSVAARLAQPRNGAYVVSKAGLNALSRVMAMELAEHRIRVNAVLPGLIDTSRMASLRDSGQWDRIVQDNVPLGRAGDGSEIAWMCTYLSSDMGAWITGQDIAVDGGATR